MIAELVASCEACADGAHDACLGKYLAMDDGGYIVLPTTCGCTICWGRLS